MSMKLYVTEERRKMEDALMSGLARFILKAKGKLETDIAATTEEEQKKLDHVKVEIFFFMSGLAEKFLEGNHLSDMEIIALQGFAFDMGLVTSDMSMRAARLVQDEIVQILNPEDWN